MYLQGAAALSPLRQFALLQRLQERHPGLVAVDSYFDYLVVTQAPLDAAESARLEALLPEAKLATFPTEPATVCWVSARLGTLSPWASKALSIAHTCGLEKITRIERLQRYHLVHAPSEASLLARLHELLYDPLTESLLTSSREFTQLFQQSPAEPLRFIPLLAQGEQALRDADKQLGLALSTEDIAYLLQAYQQLGRDPTDAELMMFAQVNSEHCRHKIFNADWTLNGARQPRSLFQMIRHTYATSPQSVLVAYRDNAAVLTGDMAERFWQDPVTRTYGYQSELAHYSLKVETHNHPTAIAPWPGAATGSGGEIRDEAATGRGGETKAGLCGFSVSHLHIPRFHQPWELVTHRPTYCASALEIMLQGPLGAAAFNNEFGRPNILGYFRTLELQLGKDYYAYHKPIMLAGGVGQMRAANLIKHELSPGDLLVVLGGPALAIGLGGGAASSRQAESTHQALDFASVQRANPEMQRRAQEVISSCVRMGDANPLIAIHDVGAGGLSNALPELVHADGLGAQLALRAIPSDEPGMSPREIWCNESQERYVLAIKPEHLPLLESIAQRERCPMAVVGHATTAPQLCLEDAEHPAAPVIDLPMATLFEDMPTLQRQDQARPRPLLPAISSEWRLEEAIHRVLQFPAVASKQFLITIGDRSVGGLIARDQCVGPYQVPVADCAVMANSFNGYGGEAMAIGERAPVALLDAAVAAHLALGEALTNLAAADVQSLSDVVLSANWMAAMQQAGEGAALYAAVQALAMELCPALKIAIPVGKDSLSMQMSWLEGDARHTASSPVSLVITAAAKVADIRRTWTPALQPASLDSQLLFIDLGEGQQGLGGSALVQAYQQLGDQVPTPAAASVLAHFFAAMQELKQSDLVLAYHDRSDGGLLATVCEMMFAGGCGVTLTLDCLGSDLFASLFNENLGAVLQVAGKHIPTVCHVLERHQLAHCTHVIGALNDSDELQLLHQEECVYANLRIALHAAWQETSFRLQQLRDNPELAAEEFADCGKPTSQLMAEVTYEYAASPAVRAHRATRPRIAILREQGVNGHVEMAAAFDRVGFTCVDVHMTDLLAGRVSLRDFQGLAACGGFSYGDVLGAGRGWAQSILGHAAVRQEFLSFFARPNTFALGVCNGCQMMAHLQELIPGAKQWPRFERNDSEQFEARVSLVEVLPSRSILLQGMAGSVLPVVVSHGEGRAVFARPYDANELIDTGLIGLRYVDGARQMTERYPANPNGSPFGITALTSTDGRVTIMMPHPERVFRSCQLSWHPAEWGENSPWIQLFQNAYDFVA